MKDDVESLKDVTGGSTGDFGRFPFDLPELFGDGAAQGPHLVCGPLHALPIGAHDGKSRGREDASLGNLCVELPGLVAERLQWRECPVNGSAEAIKDELQTLGRQTQLAQDRDGLARQRGGTAQGTTHLADRTTTGRGLSCDALKQVA